MTRTKSTKRSLLVSGLVLLMCIAMLVGSTFAWFTDSVTSANNKIVAGNLDIQLLMDTGDGYEDISNSTESIFNMLSNKAQNDNADTLWEPGKTQVVYLSIKNNGSLDLKYKVALDVKDADADQNLYEVMKYAITNDAKYGAVDAWDSAKGVSVVPGVNATQANDVALKAGEEHFFALSVHMDEAAGKQYQGGEVNFDLTVLATQTNSESDSFGSSYDMYAEYENGQQGSNISVGTASDLLTALNNLSNGQSVTLTQDIDLTGVDWSVSAPWQGPGTEVVFDGAGHKITGLTTNGLQGGLFGSYITHGNVTIKNLTLETVNLTGTDVDGVSAGGALIGWYESHGGILTIENVEVNGVNVKGFKYIGGLIGYVNPGYGVNIIDCSINGTELTSTYNESGNYKGHIGGLVGYYGKGTVTNCTVSDLTIKRAGTTAQLASSSNRAGALFGTVEGNCTVVSATVSTVTVDGVNASSDNVFGPAASASTVSKNNININ